MRSVKQLLLISCAAVLLLAGCAKQASVVDEPAEDSPQSIAIESEDSSIKVEDFEGGQSEDWEAQEAEPREGGPEEPGAPDQ